MLTVILDLYHKLLHMRLAVKSHALPVYKKHRIASLLCIFESTIKRCTLYGVIYILQGIIV